MDKNQKTPISDHLISPTRMAHKNIAAKIKVVENKDGLVQRNEQKVVTLDGKFLLKEEGNKSVL